MKLKRKLAARGAADEVGALKRTAAWASALTIVLSGCGGSAGDDASRAVAACRAIVPALNQGLYGCVTTTDDVGPQVTSPLGHFSVSVYADSASQPTSTSSVALASTVSNDLGYYELPTFAGSYWLCTSFFRCTPVTIATGEKLRRDYGFDVGPGW